MSTQKIPNSNKQWIQSNRGDYQGNVWDTFCIDLDSDPGVAKPSKPLTQILGGSDIGSDIPQALQIHDGQYYFATNDKVLDCSTTQDPTDSSKWDAIPTLGLEDLGLETDMTSFDGKLLISLGTDIMSWDGNTKDDDWWTTVAGGSALTADKTHTMEVLRTGNDTLFVTDGDTVRYYNSAAGVTGVELETFMTSHVLVPGLDRMWVGTYTEIENNAYVYEIQVGNDIATASYPLDGMAALTGFSYRNTPFFITERGYIQAFNGAGFETVAQFPFADESMVITGVRPGLVQDSATSRGIHPKGVKVRGHYAYIFINMEDEYNSGSLLGERTYSGVWVLDLNTYSLTHRYALRNEDDTTKGWSKVTRSGPLLLTNTPETRIMVAAEVNTNDEGLFMESTDTPYGFLTTMRHESESDADAFHNVTLKADTLDTGETIDVHQRAKIRPGLPLTIDDVTWLNTTQFTTTESLTGVQTTDADEQGDMLFILAGGGAGYITTVEKIEGSNTKTVTVSDAMPVSQNDTSDVKISDFKKASTQYTSEDPEYKEFGAIDGSQTFIQHRIVMEGDITLREVISKSNNKSGK